MQTYLTFDEYKKNFFPKEKDVLIYSTPEEFGRALAQRHIEMVREVVQGWLKENASTETKEGKAT